MTICHSRKWNYPCNVFWTECNHVVRRSHNIMSSVRGDVCVSDLRQAWCQATVSLKPCKYITHTPLTVVSCCRHFNVDLLTIVKVVHRTHSCLRFYIVYRVKQRTHKEECTLYSDIISTAATSNDRNNLNTEKPMFKPYPSAVFNQSFSWIEQIVWRYWVITERTDISSLF